jgi:uncharacterized membrane protein YjjP (DUF1212 family)
MLTPKEHSARDRVLSWGKRVYDFLFLPPGLRQRLENHLAIEELTIEADEKMTGEREVRIEGLIVSLLEILANVGATSHRVEQDGRRIADLFGFKDTNITVYPSSVTVTFRAGDRDRPTRSLTVRTYPSLSLWRLEKIDYMIHLLVTGSLPPHFLEAVVSEAQQMKSRYPLWFQSVSGALFSGAAATAYFNTDWNGVWIACVLSLVIQGPISYLARWKPSFALLLGPTVAFFTGLLARTMVVVGVLPRGCLNGTELAVIIMLAPGISLAVR